VPAKDVNESGIAVVDDNLHYFDLELLLQASACPAELVRTRRNAHTGLEPVPARRQPGSASGQAGEAAHHILSFA